MISLSPSFQGSLPAMSVYWLWFLFGFCWLVLAQALGETTRRGRLRQSNPKGRHLCWTRLTQLQRIAIALV